MKLFSSTTLLVGANANFSNVFDSLKGNSLKDMDMTKFLLMQMQQTQYKADPVNAASTPNDMSNFLTQLNFLNQGKVAHPNNMASLLMGGQSMTGMNKDDYMQSLKDQIKNQMYAQMNTGINGNSMMSPLLLEVAKNGAGNIDKDQFLYSSMQEPLGTIMRLKRNNQPKGDELFKRYIARTSNMFDPNDPVPSDLFIQGDTAGLKKYLLAKQIEQMKSAPGGDFTTALMYRKLTGQTADDSVSDKELMAAGMFAGQLDQSGAAVKPNDAYLMFKFLKLSSDREGGKVPAKTILEIALGDDVASIKADDFEQLFGVDQREFICMAHENSVRVPCLVNQATVTAETCPSHCCFNGLQSDGEMQQDAAVPICYHNLLGKIGAGIARHMINDDNIKSLFGGNLPTLTDLTDATTWAESQMPEVLRRLNKDEGDFFGNPQGTTSWWEQTYNDGSFNIHVTPAPSTSGSRSSSWVPHGTDMPPGWIPQTGKYGVGSEIDNEELISLDQIISSELSKVRATLNSDSYTCKLVAKKDMVNCYINNYEALSGADPEGQCAAKGCCYREGNIFEDSPVCYRSLRNGYCDPYGTADATANPQSKAMQWWAAHPQRKACGSQDGVTKHQCELNPSCCYNDSPRIAGDPWCYYRGGVETLVASGDASSDAQCNAVNVLKRQHCFDNSNKFGKVLNKMATAEQCKTAGCCYDEDAFKQNQELGGLLGGSLDLTGPHCFKRENDMLDNTDAAAWTNYEAGATGDFKVPLYKPSELTKTCDDTGSAGALWPQLTQNKWVKQNDKWVFENSADQRPAVRERCDDTTDSHRCEYTLGCCFQKSSDPRHPWCYKPRYVKTPSATVGAIPGVGRK